MFAHKPRSQRQTTNNQCKQPHPAIVIPSASPIAGISAIYQRRASPPLEYPRARRVQCHHGKQVVRSAGEGIRAQGRSRAQKGKGNETPPQDRRLELMWRSDPAASGEVGGLVIAKRAGAGGVSSSASCCLLSLGIHLTQHPAGL